MMVPFSKTEIILHDKTFFIVNIQTYLCVFTAVLEKLLLKKEDCRMLIYNLLRFITTRPTMVFSL